MAVTARLGITKLELAQSQKELTINQALDDIDAAVALLNLANSGEVYLTEAPDASVNYGVLNVGDGGFTGGGGHYAGGAGGSLIAVNLVSGGTADLINLQIAGVSKWKLGSGGNLTLGEGVNMVLGTSTGTKIGNSAAAKIGMWGATPIAQQANTTEIRAGLLAMGIFAAGGAQDLNLNGGDLIADEGKFSGALQGSGTALSFKRLSFTFAADANETLDATGKACAIIDIQAASPITATRDLLVSGNAGAFYIVINRHTTQSVNVRVGANAGILVAALRSRVLCFPGGTVCFSLTGDNNYAT